MAVAGGDEGRCEAVAQRCGVGSVIVKKGVASRWLKAASVVVRSKPFGINVDRRKRKKPDTVRSDGRHGFSKETGNCYRIDFGLLCL